MGGRKGEEPERKRDFSPNGKNLRPISTPDLGDRSHYRRVAAEGGSMGKIDSPPVGQKRSIKCKTAKRHCWLRFFFERETQMKICPRLRSELSPRSHWKLVW